MLAVEIVRPGGPEVLVQTERPMPEPGPGEVLIKVRAAGINRPDVFQRKGNYAPPPGASDLPGLEVAGEIVGGDVAAGGCAIGEQVCALVAGGGYAQYCVAPALQCLPIPKGLSHIEAAGLPETYFTVWSNVFDRARLSQGETLLVHGGASGIGTTAIQLARAMGLAVYTTVGSDERVKAVEALGANQGINYKTQDFVARIRELTAGRGVDVILDMVAGDYTARNLQCLADDGRVVIIALLGGARSEIDCNQILRRRLTITGSTLRPQNRARLVVGNWKMHGNLAENAGLLADLRAADLRLHCEIGVCVPFPYLAQAASALTGSAVSWGAQDVSAHAKGAYTGEVAGAMIKEFGCRWVLAGHSERRVLHGETDQVVADKAQAALAAGLSPVVCVGESLAERESGGTLAVIERQLRPVLALGASALAQMVLAYEPVWAIGTGLTATPEQAQEVHAAIRTALRGLGVEQVRVLYGGSVKAANAPALFAMPDIDGALVGGAALVAEEFLRIAAV
ncbi:hypothetical protein HA402_010019 [Bradysia odoriphaga]|nr:hypothetical protein HA402_010019 [Bradysia odoriphaga]